MESRALGPPVSIVGINSSPIAVSGAAVRTRSNRTAPLNALFWSSFGRSIFDLYRSFRDDDNLWGLRSAAGGPAPTGVKKQALQRHYPDRLRVRAHRYRGKSVSLPVF